MAANYDLPENGVVKRVRFFDGQLLIDQDFIDDQRYHLDRQRRTNRMLRVSGICEGLTLEVNSNKVTVKPGTALDSLGRLIVLHEPRTVVDNLSAQAGTLDIYIAYQEEEADITQASSETPPAATGQPASDSEKPLTGAKGATRWWENPKLEFVRQGSGPTGDRPLFLGRVTASTGALSLSDRQYCGIYLPSSVDLPNAPTLRSGGTTNPTLAILTGDLRVTGTSTLTGNVSMSGTLAVTGTSTLTGNVSMGGNLAVTGTRQIIFSDAGTDNNLKLQLWAGYGLGINGGTLFYAANGRHSWRDNNGTNERMALTTGADGSLTVTGSGTSSFAGSLSVGNSLTVTGTSTLTGNVSMGSTLAVTGTSTLTGNVSMGGTLAVTNTTTLTGSLTVNNTVSLKGASNRTGLSVDANGNVGIGITTTPRSALDTGTGVMTGAANDYQKAQFTMSGGGIVSWSWSGSGTNASGRLKWSQRIIAISMERSTTFSAGHINIRQPISDIPAAQVYDGTARSATANDGVSLKDWEALYAVHTVGGDENAISFRIVSYTNTFIAPSNWILVAVLNGDDRSIKLGTGMVLQANTASNNVKTNNATVDGTLSVTGASTLTGNVNMGGTLAVTGNSTLDGTLTVKQDLFLGNASGGSKKLFLTNSAITHYIQANSWWTEFVSHSNEGWKFISTNDGTTRNERMRVTGSGNVGIGTDNPGAKLDVEGAAMLGYESNITDFGSSLKSGFYQNGGQKITGDVPDADHGWTHLITARHSNTGNNHQLQIAASYSSNDRLFFRKIAGTGTVNPAWNEVATRDTNTFSGNQTIQGTMTATKLVGDGAVIAGMIVMWNGQANAVPAGWRLCDGQNRTPNLKDRFILASTTGSSPGAKTVAAVSGMVSAGTNIDYYALCFIIKV